MAALDAPEIDVKLIFGEDTYRVTVEAPQVVLKFDLRDLNLIELAMECLQAYMSEAKNHEHCGLCGPESGLGEEEACELEALHQLLGRFLREDHRR